ncbi:DinB family protein [Novipirellula artificiosorum]|uniref:DinB superfamily protein n=1 Tax=Novipirellula artificiosorum TaxID=2528016 RepID=A0A5C6DC23_9BACT|nr:DinB family protein [Novipirellula artificiosorum]TWU34362.1 DinB superfamily protein [Novipirellula artificiosorum]
MNRIVGRRPAPSETPSEYQQALIAKLDGDCVLQLLESQLFTLCELASNVCPEQVDKIHAPYGWTIRQVVEHCADAERVFGYRILRFAAGDTTPLAGWDENTYADRRFGLGNFGHLVSEMGSLRQANLLLLRRITPKAWNSSGTADNQTVSVRGLAWLAAAHLDHHMRIVAKRCEVELPTRPIDAH